MTRTLLLDLPPEIYGMLFQVLEPIDAICFGLTCSKLYTILPQKHIKTPLTRRCISTNIHEWIWRDLRHLSQMRLLAQERQEPGGHAIGTCNERPQAKDERCCQKCGISPCELYRHIDSWMGHDYEYCEVTQRFGRPAPKWGQPDCFMSKNINNHHCGRHTGLQSSATRLEQ